MSKSQSEREKIREIEKSIKQKRFAPIYYFHGEEDLLIEHTVDLLLKNALAESEKSFNLDIVNNDNIDPKDLISFVSAFPLMAERRVVVVKNFGAIEKPESLLPVIENPVNTTVLVLIGPKPDKRLKLFKAIETNGMIAEFSQLYDNEVPEWIGNKIAEKNKSASDKVCQLIQTHVGKSLREILNEIEKLFIYVGEKPEITEDDVAKVVGTSKKYNIFELQKAIGKKDLKASLEISEKMLSVGEYPVGMIVMLTKYFEKLWVIWDHIERRITKEELIKYLKLSPRQLGFLEEEIKIARSMKPEEIENALAVLLKVDEKLKSTDVDPKLLFTMMLYHIIRAPEIEMVI
ncbi:MAG: DNA polymerase III subunit delta [Ignavibacteriales bacterium]|nr:DNA polymerase III subunit delta [Ignavibacteriales bacterium]